MPETPSRYIDLKCGNRLELPALFLHPLHHEGKILRETILDTSAQTQHVAGFVISMKDWTKLSQTLYQPTIVPSPRLQERVRIVDPELHLLFTGLDSDKRDLLNLKVTSGKLGDRKIPEAKKNLRDTVMAIAMQEGLSQPSKSKQYVEELYPFMSSILFDVMRYLIDAGTETLIAPSVPITSKAIALKQIEMANRLSSDSKVLFASRFANYTSSTDFMVMIAVNAHILENTEFCERLIAMVITTRPDHVGIKVLDLDERDVPRVEAVLKFIANLRNAIDVFGRQIPIHIFNVREFGYVTFCHGASVIEMPIARKPYMHINRNNPTDPSQLGRYTHPVDLVDYTYDQLAEMSAMNGLPCSCTPCQNRREIGDKDTFNEFRKKHFVCLKGGFEMDEIHKADADSLNIALRDKFGRSKQTGLVAYLERIVAVP
ncbi:MAG: hypothetical protein ABSD41_07620 [Candidatus Bathyarchaeia archaeon]